MKEQTIPPSALISSIALIALLCTAATGAIAAEPPAGPALETVRVRSTAHFGFDQATIRPDDQARLLAEVAKMTDVTWQTVIATGHTDSVGPVEHNRRLSARRAAAVKGYLVGKGLDPAMIETGAKAAEAPVARNDDATGRSRNRRTEIVFQGVRTTRP